MVTGLYRKIAQCLWMMAVAISPSFAQPYKFRHLTTAQGLLSDQRITMAEDRIGRLWIASDEGVNVFDGHQLTSYSNPGPSNLLHNNITQIFCDAAGAIWVAHNKGIQYLPAGSHRFIALSMPELPDPQGLMFGQTAAGVFMISRSGCYLVDSNYRVRPLEGLNAVLKEQGFVYALEKLDGEHWLLGCARNVVRVDMPQQKLVRTFPYTYAWALCAVNDSLVMVGSFAKAQTGIVNLRSGEIENINNWKTSDGLPMGGFAGSIEQVGPGRFALASRYFGVYLIDVRTRFATHLVSDPNDGATLYSNFCRSLFVTRDRTIFVHAKGLSWTSLQPNKFQSVARLHDRSGASYRAVINCFWEDDKNTLWIGTNVGLLPWRNGEPAGNFISYYANGSPGSRQRTIRHLAADAHNRLWAATFNGGLARLENGKRFIRSVGVARAGPYRALPHDVFAIVPDHKKNFLVCAYNGLSYFNPAADSLQLFTHHPVLKAIAGNRTFYALADRRHNWWVAQINGLFHYDVSRNVLTPVTLPGEKNAGIQCVAEDSAGNVYAAGHNGVHIFKHGQLTAYKTLRKQDGLASDNIIGLLCDRNGAIWIIGNKGLARYDPQSEQLTPFDANDGLLPGNHQFSSYHLARDGTVYIGGVDGFIYFHPDSVRPQPHPLSMHIMQLQAQDTSVAPAGKQHITLPWNRNHLTFSYIAVHYTMGSQLQYRYRMNGFDTAYVYAGKERTARYTNLHPGRYVFVAEVSANGKDWYAAEEPVTVIIATPFWKNRWLQLTAVALLAALAIFIYKRRIRQIDRNARMRADFEIRLNELENSALRTQMNPHFIFNCLNTINAFVNSNDRIQANQYISKFSRLIRLILDHSRQRKITLAEELEALILYIQIERFRFDNKFAYRIVVDEQLDPGIIEIPSLMIQPFVENAILHGLLPLKRAGNLLVQVLREEAHLLCIIQDDGVGMAYASNNNLHKAMKKKSHGMDITLKRIELFNRENGLDAKPVIADGKDERGQPQGTRVEIRLAWLESF